MSAPSQRARFLAAVLGQMRAPYRWGGKGEWLPMADLAVVPNTFLWLLPWSAGVRAFDCSGLVTWAYREAGGPDWRQTHGCQRLLEVCRPLPSVDKSVGGERPLLVPKPPQPGTLVLYGPSPTQATHVMVHVGEGMVVGASGGGSHTLTLEDARQHSAQVHPFSMDNYRGDLIAYRELPFADES